MPLLEDRAGLHPERLARLQDIVGRHETLEDFLHWASAQVPPVRVTDVVPQDEFTNDVLVRLDGTLHLVYDVT